MPYKRGYISFIILAGLPATTTLGGTSLVTTEPPATIELSPIFTHGKITELPPIQTLSPIMIGIA